MLKGKHIILGITGSIAAYKAAYIIRGLVKKGGRVLGCYNSCRKGIHYSNNFVGVEQ